MNYLLFPIIYLLLESYSCNLSCKDENNNDVDWFIGLKYPKSFDFIYIDSSNYKKWTTPKYNLSNGNNLIGLTVRQTFYAQQTNAFFAMYNDEPVNKSGYNFDRGHLKGVLNFDDNQGFWLLHSVPKFPSFGKYDYEHAQSVYAQSFLCVTLSSDNFKNIVSQLLIMQSSVYNYHMPNNFPNDETTRKMATMFVNNINLNNRNKSQVIQLKTIDNLPLLHFGKSSNFGKDLYSELVTKYMKSSLFVESWIRGDKISSTCDSKYKVYNVEKVKLLNTEFIEHDDHSKWAVSDDAKSLFICIGDINRMTTQFKRGGGTLCVRNENIWKIFNATITQYEHCENLLYNVLPKFDIL